MLPITSFDDKSKLYDRFRPTYSTRYINLLSSLGINKNSHIADIGAGTGKHSTALLELTDHLYCIEPNREMLSVCRNKLSNNKNIHFLCAPAEKTSAPDNSFHFITIAQAFHLLDSKKCFGEFSRIMKPDGKVVITWQSKNHNTPLFIDTEKVLIKYCPSYSRDLHAPRLTPYSYESFFPSNSFDFYYFGNDTIENQEEEVFLGRTLSASYSLTQNDQNYDSYVSALQEVFHKYSCKGVIRSALSTVVYVGKLN